MNHDIHEPLWQGLAAVDDFLADVTDESKLLIGVKCKSLLRGYHERWRDAGYEALAVENTLTAPLTNVESGRKSRTYSIAGKLDVIAQYMGKRIIIDHKTTSNEITDPSAPYWRQLAIEGQVSHYMLLDWMQGHKADGAMWDVVRKPSTSPKKLSKADRTMIVSCGKYFGSEISEEDRRALADGEERESIEMYGLRLAHDCITERPAWYFQRRNVQRLDGEMFEYATELWEHGQEMLRAKQIHEKRKDKSKIEGYARNSGACLLYGSACQFLGICSGHDSPDSDRWQRKASVHSELPTIEGDGKDVLTNSRIRCFQTCRRKAFYQYELGIERYDAEEKESLYTGHLWHLALEKWWECFVSQTVGECNDNST